MIARKLVEKKYEGFKKKTLEITGRYGIILNRDILVFVWSCKAHDRRIILAPRRKTGGPKMTKNGRCTLHEQSMS